MSTNTDTRRTGRRYRIAVFVVMDEDGFVSTTSAPRSALDSFAVLGVEFSAAS